MAEAHVVLTANQASALARIERQENNLARIKEANTQRYRDQVVDLDLTPTPPERKPAFTLEDDQRPYLKVGEFTKVKRDMSAGNNQPEGYGYIVATFGMGLAAYYTVKYTPGYDGGRVHKCVRLGDLTPCSPFEECLAPGSKRDRNQSIQELELELEEEEKKIDDMLPIEKLCGALLLGVRRGKVKGWHRCTLQLGNSRCLNKDEEQQFKIELMLLEQHLSEPSMQ